MATRRRLAGNIRRELIAAELERLRKENDTLRQSRARLIWALRQRAKEENAACQGWLDECSRAERYRGLLHEFLSTHCAPLDLRERATAAVGKPPLEFGTKETK